MAVSANIPDVKQFREIIEMYRFGVTDRLYRAAHRTGDVVARKELLAQKATIEQLDKEQLATMYIQDLLQRDYNDNVYENGKVCGTDTEIKMTVSEQGKEVQYFSFGIVEGLILQLRKYAQEADAATREILKQIEHDALRIDVKRITTAYEFTLNGATYRISFEKQYEGIVPL